MKFVCDNCKAKYQIGDDKVSGKTVRMKCRRCGHLILVAAAVTESSVSRAAPAEGTQLGSAGSGATPLPVSPRAEPVRGAPQMDLDALVDDEESRTVIMSVGLKPPSARPAAPPARPNTGGFRAPAAPRSSATSAPMPSAVGGGPPGAPRPPPPKPGIPRASLAPQAAPSAPSLSDLASRSMSGAVSAAARGDANPVGPGLRAPSPGGPTSGVNVSSFGMSPAVARSSGGFGNVPARSLTPSPGAVAPISAPASAPPTGVAGAFQRAIAGTQPVLRADTPGEDWYVGVGGVPLGPVRLSVIREKVEQGAVDGESLVWREGFDEWQPLRNVPGLRAILDERRATSPPEAGRITSSGRTAPTPVPGSLPAVPAPPPATGGTNGHGSLSLGNVPTGGVSLGPAASPAHDRAGALPANGAAAAPLAPASADPFSPFAAMVSAPAAAAPLAAAPAPLTPASLPPPSREEKKGMHPFAYAMIAMAAVFGGVAAWVLLRPPPAQVIVMAPPSPTGPELTAPPPPPTATGEASPETPNTADPKATGEARVGPGPGPRASAAPTARPGDPLPNTGSFDQGVGGPTAGPGKDGAGSGRGQLSEGEINGVVQRNMAGVRRRCWQPALDARAANAPKSASVRTTITISPGGGVSSVSASGGEQHFPGLASCIAGAVRGWQFPPSDGPTTVNIPFSFVSQ